jgi:hypothetical protein
MNKHIEDYCKEYIESETSPQFAIFLKGEWGCGKTHFINKIRESYTEESEKIKKSEIMYLSLFGISQVSEIDDLIFSQLYPVLSSKLVSFSSKLVCKLTKLTELGVSSIKDVFGKKSVFNIDNLQSKKLIIVDDIERTSLSPSQVFGYFSEYLYQKRIKIIFIGNEEHIASNDEDSKDKYRKIKEKTIGIEFLIEPESERAIDSFIEELSLTDEKFDGIKDLCMNALAILKCNNLRTLRQCLYNLKILFNTLEEEAVSKHGKDIARIFINLFIQKNLGFISERQQIHAAIIAYDQDNMNYKEYINKQKQQQDHDQIWSGLMRNNIHVPLNNCWEGIIFDGNYSKEVLSKEYEQENAVNTQEQPKNLFLLMNDWRGMDRNKFVEILNKTDADFTDGVYLHPGEILHYANIMLIFSMWGLIAKTKEEIIKLVNDTITKYKDKVRVVDDWSMLDMSYAGYMYDMTVPGLKEIHDLLKSVSDENRFIAAKEKIAVDVKNMETNISEFCQNLVHANGTNKYYKIPFLSLVNIQDFVDKFVALNVSDQSCIILAMEGRYGKKYTNGEIFKQENILDKENLIEFTKLYDGSLGEIENNPQELLKKDISKRLHELREYFEK